MATLDRMEEYLMRKLAGADTRLVDVAGVLVLGLATNLLVTLVGTPPPPVFPICGSVVALTVLGGCIVIVGRELDAARTKLTEEHPAEEYDFISRALYDRVTRVEVFHNCAKWGVAAISFGVMTWLGWHMGRQYCVHC